MNYSLQDVARMTGVPYAVIKKHGQRGKLRTKIVDRHTVVDEVDLEAYMVSEKLAKVADVVEGQSLPTVTREYGNAIGSLAPAVRDAILEGIPGEKKPGGPAAFLKATANAPVPREHPQSDDPHWGFPIGHQHELSPRWMRTSETKWFLDGASWSWNGLFWEGGGSKAGTALGEGISPASPYVDDRPLAPSKAVKVDGKS